MGNSIRLTENAVWLHDGVEVTHARTQQLFFKSVLYRNGKYFLSGEKEPVPIEVDDVAYFVKDIKFNKGVLLSLSNQTVEPMQPSSLDLLPNNHLVCHLQNGAPARFEKKAYYQIMQTLTEKSGYLGLTLDGIFYPLQVKERLSSLASRLSPEKKKKNSGKNPKPSPKKKKSTVPKRKTITRKTKVATKNKKTKRAPRAKK